ncbi:hypothetical protein BC939DRAFT_471579 [Gamsiella multidivaricata]|uniref:uncharacterized protein n=1 Tax=Gamsiella multidivaricata TaxID=101098 RepID=UPI0022212958|nr:uncharacterized protein BC939DRAFT_471579 [Gamsiella multidivaricata]KAI7815798.1 hypothetical protein BC939DRAFT_471579 [Gamsiella multidivaricata]
MPNTKAKAKNSRAITTTTITTIVTTTVTSPKPPAKRGLATNAKTIRPSATSASGPSTDKRQRRFISLSLKADFIKDVLAEQELDPRFPAASVGRRQKYNFTRAEISRMIRDADDTPRKVQEASHRNPVKISRIYPRKMEVIEKVLYSQLKNEIDSSRYMCLSSSFASIQAG